MMEFLREPLFETAAMRETEAALQKKEGPIQLAGAVESLKSYIMFKAGSVKTRLLVSYDEVAAKALYDEISGLNRNTVYFPGKDFLFYQADAKSNSLTIKRLQAIRGLLSGTADFVVTTVEAMMNALMPLSAFEENVIDLKEADELSPEDLKKELIRLGYRNVPRVEEAGEFSAHGGIVDVYDMTAEMPVRIEFFGDEIDTIRWFHPTSQLSADRVSEVHIFPASELCLSDEVREAGLKRIEKDVEKGIEAFKNREEWENAAALQKLSREIEDGKSLLSFENFMEQFLPYFYERPAFLEEYIKTEYMCILDEPARLKDRGQLLTDEFVQSFQNRLLKGLTLPKNGNIVRSVKQFLGAMDRGNTLVFTALDTRVTQVKVKNVYRVEGQSMVTYSGNYKGLLDDLLNYQKQKYTMVLLVNSATRGKRLTEEMAEYGLKTTFLDPDSELITGKRKMKDFPGHLFIAKGYMHRGFVIPGKKFVLLTEADISIGEKKKPKRRAPQNGEHIKTFKELSFGDYVVHEQYGIGIYQGIVNMKVDNVARDYVKIAYQNNGAVYVPVTNLSVVQKYASQDARPPRIASLSSQEWNKTKSRVKAAVTEVAEELVTLYAAREAGTGYKYSPDTDWQKEFEELFPFEETEDQLAAIEDVKRDMESGKIMDRLLCGDVGFGKTEVAIRAAFKAVMEGKQVAYLVPTTILAKQHYNTFRERMKDYPIEVESLSRFTSAEQCRKIIKNLKEGKTDIVIGTHKILSEKVAFKDLGLLIIDEEQRFGVNHKEKIKQMKKTVDVLTLTATPIPRTLHMAMIGIRDLSVLTEPPEDRKAIQTYVMEYQEELVREAILRETARGGQVYYVYNRTRDISVIADELRELLPDTRISYIHGKMKEDEIEREMLSFIEGETDVLVSTTIIETGIDIPNVNTIIIHDADRYGLAQLYQLRGRVGRSNRQAYAFIMYQKQHLPSEDAEKRLAAIRQFTELGSGIRIAEQDLEIRGAGAVLGNAQSGHMTEVGYELYSKMLRAAVLKARGEKMEDAEEETDTEMEIHTNAYIPDSYLPSEREKLELYKRISCLASEEETTALEDELIDRFGDVPNSVLNLLEVARLKLIAKEVFITKIKGNERTLDFFFTGSPKIRVENLPVLLQKMNGAMQYNFKEVPILSWHERNGKDVGKRPVLAIIRELLTTIKELLI